jgi:dienelactone hydrolase
MRALWLFVLLVFGLVVLPRATGQDAIAAKPASAKWIEREFMVPAPASPDGIEVLKVEVDRPGKHPLALITHASPSEPVARGQMTAWSFMPQAIWFARRGYVVLVVIRKGYGRSTGVEDGSHSGCQRAWGGSFTQVGEKDAADLRAAIDWAGTQPEIDTSTVISAGISTGGYAQVALTMNAPPGLKAAINFAGGRGEQGAMHNCNERSIVASFDEMGRKSTVPMLWIYAENDRSFWPDLAREFDAAFRDGGGKDELVIAPPYANDGHRLFYDVNGWSQYVDQYLKEKGLLPVSDLLPEPSTADVSVPPGLSGRGQTAFHNFLIYGPYKAFATNGQAAYGSANAGYTQEDADAEALAGCQRNAKGGGVCAVVSRGAPQK